MAAAGAVDKELAANGIGRIAVKRLGRDRDDLPPLHAYVGKTGTVANFDPRLAQHRIHRLGHNVRLEVNAPHLRFGQPGAAQRAFIGAVRIEAREAVWFLLARKVDRPAHSDRIRAQSRSQLIMHPRPPDPRLPVVDTPHRRGAAQLCHAVQQQNTRPPGSARAARIAAPKPPEPPPIIRISVSIISFPAYQWLVASRITGHQPLVTIHYPLSTIHYPLSTTHYPLSTAVLTLSHHPGS